MDEKIKAEFRSFLLKKRISKNISYNIISRVGTLERLLNVDTNLVIGDYEKSKDLIHKLTLQISKKKITKKSKNTMKGTLLSALRFYASFKKGKEAERYLFHHFKKK